ncbi:hypothetical protein MHBO_001243 [Bonamia ostreae]|uniref:Uncharacterized protein n=1 Tax=Bonamia ostreae TaxID=126728 RepID=A0ABV2AIA8_9EUKA
MAKSFTKMIICYFVLFLASFVLPSKHVFEKMAIEGFPESLDFEPMRKSPENEEEQSAISYSLEFEGSPGHSVFFVLGRREDLNDGVICASKELKEILPLADSKMKIITIDLENGYKKIEGKYVIEEDSLYTFIFVSCEKENFLYKESKPITVSGQVSLRGPYGFLPPHKQRLVNMVYNIFNILLTV